MTDGDGSIAFFETYHQTHQQLFFSELRCILLKAVQPFTAVGAHQVICLEKIFLELD